MFGRTDDYRIDVVRSVFVQFAEVLIGSRIGELPRLRFEVSTVDPDAGKAVVIGDDNANRGCVFLRSVFYLWGHDVQDCIEFNLFIAGSVVVSGY